MVIIRRVFSRSIAAISIIFLFAVCIQSCSTARSGRMSCKATRVLHAEAVLPMIVTGSEKDTLLQTQQAPALAIAAIPVQEKQSAFASKKAHRNNSPQLSNLIGMQFPKQAISKFYAAQEQDDEGDDEDDEGSCCVNRWCLSYFLFAGILILALALIGSATTITPLLSWLALILILILIGITIAFLVYVLEDGDRRDNLLSPPKGRRSKKTAPIEIQE